MLEPIKVWLVSRALKKALFKLGQFVAATAVSWLFSPNVRPLLEQRFVQDFFVQMGYANPAAMDPAQLKMAASVLVTGALIAGAEFGRNWLKHKYGIAWL